MERRQLKILSEIVFVVYALTLTIVKGELNENNNVTTLQNIKISTSIVDTKSPTQNGVNTITATYSSSNTRSAAQGETTMLTPLQELAQSNETSNLKTTYQPETSQNTSKSVTHMDTKTPTPRGINTKTTMFDSLLTLEATQEKKTTPTTLQRWIKSTGTSTLLATNETAQVQDTMQTTTYSNIRTAKQSRQSNGVNSLQTTSIIATLQDTTESYANQIDLETTTDGEQNMMTTTLERMKDHVSMQNTTATPASSLGLTHPFESSQGGTLASTTSDITKETTNLRPYNKLKELYAEILIDYDIRIKPKKDLIQAVTVMVEFSLSNIVNFDTASQKLDIAGIITLKWNDEFIAWEEDRFDGIDKVSLPVNQVWSPGVVVGKSFEGQSKLDKKESAVSFLSNGNATWTTEGTYSIVCAVDTKYYPHDRQTCEFIVSVPDALTSEISLEPSKQDLNLNSYSENSDWKLIELLPLESYSQSQHVYFNIHLQRRATLIMHTVIAPFILLSVMNLFVFVIPADNKEKSSIAVTIFLAYSLCISTVSDEIPKNAVDLSYIFTYVLIQMTVSAATVIYCIIQNRVFSLFKKDPERTHIKCKCRIRDKRCKCSTSVFFIIVDGVGFIISFLAMGTSSLALYMKMGYSSDE